MSDNSPAVAVVVPTKDRRELLAQTIASVQQQTFANWELIVVDDASADGTAEPMQDLARRDPRIKYHRLSASRAGAPAARNEGVRQSTAPLIVFLDSDDLVAPNMLARRLEVMAAHPAIDFAVFPCYVFREQPHDTQAMFNADTGEDDLDRLLKVDVPWQTTGPIWRRGALEKVGPWDEEALTAQDWEFHIRAVAAGLRYQRFGPADCYWRSASGQRDSIGKASQLEARYMRNRADIIGKIYRLLRERGLVTEPRRQMFVALYFRAAETFAQRVSRRAARGIWRAAWRDGVIGFRQFVQGWIYLFAMRWPKWRERELNRLRRSWPDSALPKRSETFLRASLAPARAAS